MQTQITANQSYALSNKGRSEIWNGDLNPNFESMFFSRFRTIVHVGATIVESHVAKGTNPTGWRRDVAWPQHRVTTRRWFFFTYIY